MDRTAGACRCKGAGWLDKEEEVRERVSGQACMRSLRRLMEIGVRVAGTQGEKSAADWIEGCFRETGLVGVRRQSFPVLTFGHRKCKVEALFENGWREIPSEPGAHSPATSAEGLEADLVRVEKIPGSLEQARPIIQGRIPLIYASHLLRRDNLERTMAARPAAVLVVDDRFTGDWTVFFGLPAAWIRMVTAPIVSIPYLFAWELARQRVERIRIHLDSWVEAAESSNVIGEIRGSASPEEIIVVSSHHDSVANNPGLDDNGTGVAGMLQLARLFSGTSPRRTLRFISFGAEEQLSEGARHYAQTADDVEKIQFQLNLDSIGAWMGQTGIYCAGPDSLPAFVEEVNDQTRFSAFVTQELSPFSDHFPLNVAGVPAVWYERHTFSGGRHFHHSRLETLDVISPDVLDTTVSHLRYLLDRFVNDEKLPSPREISESQRLELRRLAEEWMDLSAAR